MTITKIRKRNGQIVDFDRARISFAVQKAAEDTQKKTDNPFLVPANFSDVFSSRIAEELSKDFGEEKIPHVEGIQDIVEQQLVESGHFEIAKNYILYRAEHARVRAERRIEELRKIEKNLLKVRKRDGTSQGFDVRKIRKLFMKAASGHEKECRFEELFEVFRDQLTDGISTAEILERLKRSSVDLVSIENPNWQIIAARFYLFQLYSEACRNRELKHKEIYSPRSFRRHFEDYVKKGLYYSKFFECYTQEEIEEAGGFIDPQRDFTYIYSTVLAFDRRYLLNPNKVIHELPQEMYLAVALFLATPEKKENRLRVAREIYEATSSQKLSLPTPTLLNARTNFHQLASCFKLNIGDDLRSIYHGIENMAQISKFGGGVGVYLGHIRSRGATIRGTEGASGGVIPWARVINDTACAVNQLGARMGAISPTLDIWHRDIHDFLNLQTETGDIRSKAFDVYPAISVPDIFMRRAEKSEVWTLFDPHEVRSVMGRCLEDAFGEDFDTLYEECEKEKCLKLKVAVRAKELMKVFLKTAVETGMPYVFFRDTVNRLNPNRHAGRIYSSQLCTEICQNTAPPKFEGEAVDGDSISLQYRPGDTVVCNLASINMAKVHTDEEIRAVIPVAMRLLDNVIDLNFYPIKESEVTAKRYRSVGLGFMGLAEYLARKGLRFDSKEARSDVDVLFEKYALAVLSESRSLAVERGPYELFKGSDWEKGILFGRDEKWYEKHSHHPKAWKKLIAQISRDGLRFAYHLAPAPNTSTSGVVGTTAGLLPVYKKFFVETNALAPIVTVAPGLSKENFWLYKEYVNMDMKDIIDMIAVTYKWVDQSVSFEWMIDPARMSPKDLFDCYMKTWRSGIKTVYYLRSLSGEMREACESCSG